MKKNIKTYSENLGFCRICHVNPQEIRNPKIKQLIYKMI